MKDARVLPGQVRAARALLNWGISDLSSSSGVSVRTIKYFESGSAEQTLKEGTSAKLIAALEAAGIEFIGTPDDGPGIRFRPKS